MSGFDKKTRAIITLRAGGVCERCGLSGNLQFHHRRPRAMGGSRRRDTNQPANGVLVCVRCHCWIEGYREAALETGWLVRQWRRPCEAPIYRHDQWVVLDDLGYVTPAEEGAA